MKMGWRQHKRYAVALPAFLFGEGFADYRSLGIGKVFNISESGCKVATNTQFKIGDSVALRFYVPSHRHQIRVPIAMVRSARSGVCRLEFISIRDGDNEHLHEFIQTLEQASQPQPA